MKETHTYTKTIHTEEVISITCNRCGISDENIDSSNIETWSHNFGYGSKFDTDIVEFELCDVCYSEIIDNFIHKPLIIGMGL